jgi:hypothetical protein
MEAVLNVKICDKLGGKSAVFCDLLVLGGAILFL